jgi:hypothetical protein
MKTGDVLSFICKDGSFGMCRILKIDTPDDLPVAQPVYHLAIYTLRSPFPPNAAYLPDANIFIGHLPIMQTGIEKSGCSVIATKTVVNGDLYPYAVWRDAFFQGEAGIFDVAIDEAVTLVIEALGKSNQPF